MKLRLTSETLAAALLAALLGLPALAGDDGPKEKLMEMPFVRKGNIIQRDNLWDGIDKDGNLKVKGGHLNTLRHGTSRGDYYVGPSICFADVTGDGRPDLVVGGENGFIWYFEQISKPGTFPPRFGKGTFLHMQCSVESLLHVDVQDLEDDGKNDLVYSSDTGEIFSVRGLGQGIFKVSSPVSIFPKEPYLGRGFTPRFYDWDGDGVFDLYFGDSSYSANAVYFYHNYGTPSNSRFNPTDGRKWLAYGYGHEMLDPTHGDLNGDGKMDLLVADAQGKLLLFYAPEKQDPENPVLLDFQGELTVDGKDVPVGEGARCYLYDIDRDGLLDLFLSDVEGFFYVSRNIGVKARPAFAKPVQLTSKDVWKPYPTLNDWKEEQAWPKNSAPIARQKTEKILLDKMTGKMGDVDFVRLTYADGYIGGTGALVHKGMNLLDGVSYSIRFKVRGQGGKGRIRMEQWWEGERRGDTIHQTKYDHDKEFSLSSEFADVSFTHDAHHSSKTIEEKSIYFVLHFYLMGEATNCFMDISDVTMTRVK